MRTSGKFASGLCISWYGGIDIYQMWSWHYSEKSTYFGPSEVGVKRWSLRFATMEKRTDEASLTKFELLNLDNGHIWGSLYVYVYNDWEFCSDFLGVLPSVLSPELSCTYNPLWLFCQSPGHTHQPRARKATYCPEAAFPTVAFSLSRAIGSGVRTKVLT